MPRLLLLCLLALSLPLSRSAVAQAAVIADWNFDNCTAQESGGTGLNGTMTGTPSCVTGMTGKALQFNAGSGYLQIPDDMRLSPLTSLVLEAAVKPNSLENDLSGLIFKQDDLPGVNEGYALMLYGSYGVRFDVAFEGESFPSSFILYEDVIPLNQWSRIRAEADSMAGRVRIFVDGQLKLEQECPKRYLVRSAAPLRIGAASMAEVEYGYATELSGAIDDVRISSDNTLLTTSLTGTGKGAVNSIPSGVSCAAPSCSTYLPSTAPLTLVATPDADSLFSGWSGACTNSSGNCLVSMTANREVSATFSSNLPVKRLGSPAQFFPDIGSACQSLNGGSATLLARKGALSRDAVMAQPAVVRLNGGYDDAFGSVVGRTLLSGKLLVRRGSLIVRNIAVTTSSSPVASSTPAQSATAVAPGAPIAVTMRQNLDPASVSSATVTLVGKGRFGYFQVPGSVGYDAAVKRIQFLPGALRPGCSYTLKLSELKDSSGNPVPDATITFSTKRNQLQRSVSYRGDGSVAEYSVREFESDGRPSAMNAFIAPGSDGNWFNGDDIAGRSQTDIYDYSYDSGKYSLSGREESFGNSYLSSTEYTFDDGRLMAETVYGNGGDGETRYSYDFRGYLREVHHSYGGEEKIRSYTVSLFGADGIKSGDVVYYSTTSEGAPLGNDQVARYVSCLREAGGLPWRQVSYEGAGADGVWMTSDDAVAGYWEFSYTAGGLLDRAVYRGGAGSDGVWFTTDDAVAAYLAYRYDAAGNRTESVRYTGAGADSAWFTSDDLRSQVNTFDTTW